MRERIQVLEEEKEELKRRGAKNEKKKEEEGGRDEKGKECVEDTERMLLAVLRELEGIPRYNPLKRFHLRTQGFIVLTAP